tara:strand:+ start:292 stop:972 length:681 start_codon:yes stop_codon:yes gene_type:complete
MGFIINSSRFAVVATDSYTTDFSSNDGWVGTGTYSYNASGYLAMQHGTGAIVIDLEDADVFGTGNLLSNTKNYFEFAFDIKGESGADNEQMNGFSSANQTADRNTSQAWFGCSSLIGYGVSPAANGMYVESTASGAVSVAGQGLLAAYNWSTGNFRIKIRRLSATTCSVQIWNEAGDTKLGDSGTHTILSGEGNNLKYCKFLTYPAASSAYTIEVPDLIIRNGVSE